MKNHHVRVHRSEENLERKDQLAWKLAEAVSYTHLRAHET